MKYLSIFFAAYLIWGCQSTNSEIKQIQSEMNFDDVTQDVDALMSSNPNTTELAQELGMDAQECEEEARIWSEPELFQWPLQGKLLSYFGKRGKRFHKGIDIKGKRGEPIRAAKGGEVVYAGWQRGYGKLVIIEHDNSRTLYAHCQNIKVKKGTKVRSGQVIATVGSSGNARGAHLHFEIRTDTNDLVNPLSKLPSSIAWGTSLPQPP